MIVIIPAGTSIIPVTRGNEIFRFYRLNCFKGF
jgi:hypothetical protein